MNKSDLKAGSLIECTTTTGTAAAVATAVANVQSISNISPLLLLI